MRHWDRFAEAAGLSQARKRVVRLTDRKDCQLDRAALHIDVAQILRKLRDLVVADVGGWARCGAERAAEEVMPGASTQPVGGRATCCCSSSRSRQAIWVK